MTRIIAIDWSGKAKYAALTIWLAEAVQGQLVRLENGRTRDDIADWLIDESKRDPDIVAGFDFAFSMPAWYLLEQGFADAPSLWNAMHGGLSEQLLGGCETPLWGRRGKRKPPPDEARDCFRATDRAHVIGGIAPKSVFQIGGAGAVGTGSLRGMPVLYRLHEAGFHIWPFCDAGLPRVIEIYPRLLTGPVRKRRGEARQCYIATHCPDLDAESAHVAASTEDAFDAAVSALVMSAHANEFRNLPAAADQQQQLEGLIWAPRHAACACS
ncbi:MAG: hypothetical protein M3P30_00480 [Chloroflexota bacterium]|nr:hypothetical protein [Chloroflexota bacterium]